MKLQDFSFSLSNTFIFELILIKISMNANIVKSRYFINEVYLKGHSRSEKTTFLFKNTLFLLFCLYYWLIEEKSRLKLWKNKTTVAIYKDDICLIQRRHRFCVLKCTLYLKMQIFLRWSMTEGHIGPLSCYGEVAWLSYFQILSQPWFMLLWTTFVLVF